MKRHCIAVPKKFCVNACQYINVLYATMGQLPSFLLNTQSAARQSFNGVLENYPSEQQHFHLVKVTVRVGWGGVVPSCCITTLNFFMNFSRFPNYQLIGWKMGNIMEYPSLKNSPCGAAHQPSGNRRDRWWQCSGA